MKYILSNENKIQNLLWVCCTMFWNMTKYIWSVGDNGYSKEAAVVSPAKRQPVLFTLPIILSVVHDWIGLCIIHNWLSHHLKYLVNDRHTIHSIVFVSIRSPSPEPIYNSEGKRLNTREFRVRKKLEEERHVLIQEALILNEDYKPPADYKLVMFVVYDLNNTQNIKGAFDWPYPEIRIGGSLLTSLFTFCLINIRIFS